MNADPLQALSRFVVTSEQVSAMQATRMIWRNIIAHGHAQVWAAPANGGKTTIARLAAADLSKDGFRVLFFQEDAGAGDLPALHGHAVEHGYSLLNSTMGNANPTDLIQVLRDLVAGGADLSEFVLFFDTLKKFLDLMSKSRARDFFALMRSLTQRGATVVLLGHTNKHRTHDGKLIFEGVGDVRNDVDELIYIEATDKDAAGVVLLTMTPDKVRCHVREATFKLDTRSMQIEPQNEVIDVPARRARAERMEQDAPAIRAICNVLQGGSKPFRELSTTAAGLCGIGERTMRKVIERYAGNDADDLDAIWLETYQREYNTRLFSLPPSPRCPDGPSHPSGGPGESSRRSRPPGNPHAH
jgi:hypothetical protein